MDERWTLKIEPRGEVAKTRRFLSGITASAEFIKALSAHYPKGADVYYTVPGGEPYHRVVKSREVGVA